MVYHSVNKMFVFIYNSYIYLFIFVAKRAIDQIQITTDINIIRHINKYIRNKKILKRKTLIQL